MASTDARPVPIKNTAYRHYFEIIDINGDLVTTWAGADSEKSLDGASFVDCSNEATEIGTTGCGYIDLTATEMNVDCCFLKVTVTNTDAKVYTMPIYPEDSGDIRVDATQLGGDSQSLSDLKDFADAGYDPATNKVQGVVLVDTTTTLTNKTGFSIAGTKATLDALQDISAANVLTQAVAALAAIHLDKLFATAYDPASKPGHANALWNSLIENDGGLPRFLANVLEMAPSGGGGGGSGNVTQFNGSSAAVTRLVAILLAEGSSDKMIAANLVSTPLSPSHFSGLTDAGDLQITRGSPVSHTIEGMGNMNNATAIWVAGKEQRSDGTGSEVFKIKATYDGSNNEISNALIVSAKGSPLAGANASITVLDWDNGDIQFTIKSVEVARFAPFAHDKARYAGQYKKDGETPEPKMGRFTIVEDVIQETS